MASDQKFVDFVLGQIQCSGEITAKKNVWRIWYIPGWENNRIDM